MKNIAIVGATGLAGRELLKLIHLRDFPLRHIKLFASQQSAGRVIRDSGQSFDVQSIRGDMFDDIDIAFFAVDGELSRRLAPLARASGAIVIDKSSAFRMDPHVPLVIPEINSDAIRAHAGIIASPNCSTTIMLTGLWPLLERFGASRIIVSTYQSMSGGGAGLVEGFEKSVKMYVEGRDTGPLFNNVTPHIDAFDAGGNSGEETKMVEESRKILAMPDLPISATCVRVPILRGHSMAINIEFPGSPPVSPEEARALIRDFDNGIRLMDEPDHGVYPMPINTNGEEFCAVGRIRKDTSSSNGLCLWISGDNLWKGAALNALQIAEKLA
ncbi:MAG: aspartate-semialdehyde dehydrogenase [Patescibacteria group bacterium]|nr:aspartate-semialdehyde dehydrogenase [Patescibacteria group bacterium]MDE2116907.1 aspartate-semialdehyde dehydrogenase [Patescibacteria group bacterium]